MSAVVRVPISPSPNFLNRMALLTRSAELVGRDFGATSFEAYVSPDRPDPPRSWVTHLESLGVTWIDVDRSDFDAHSYAAASWARFRTPTDHDVAVLADADLVFAGSIADAAARCADEGAVLGVTAYRTPFTVAAYPARATLSPRAAWSDLFDRLGLEPPTFTSTHPAGYEQDWDDAISRCPPYFNFGMVFVPTAVAADLGVRFAEELPAVCSVFAGAHSAQLALTAALQRGRIPSGELPLRYNFPNQVPYVAQYLDELTDLRVLHYMNTKRFDKEADLDSPSALRAWMQRVPDDPLHQRLATLIESTLPILERCPWNQR